MASTVWPRPLGYCSVTTTGTSRCRAASIRMPAAWVTASPSAIAGISRSCMSTTTRAERSRRSRAGLARISHQGHGLRGALPADRVGAARSASRVPRARERTMRGHRTSGVTHTVGRRAPPFGSRPGARPRRAFHARGSARCGPQPYSPIRFSARSWRLERLGATQAVTMVRNAGLAASSLRAIPSLGLGPARWPKRTPVATPRALWGAGVSPVRGDRVRAPVRNEDDAEEARDSSAKQRRRLGCRSRS